MSESWTALDLPGLAESCDLECKSAQGRDGRGEVPDDFWKSYSAMANADGGLILLGVQEKPRGQFLAVGVPDVERLRKALWDNLHNRKQVSVNLLSEQDIAPIAVDGKTVLLVPDGAGRGMVYFLPWQKQFAGSIFQRLAQSADAPAPAPIPPQLAAIPPQLTSIPPELETVAPQSPRTYLDWAEVPPELQRELTALASPISQSRRVSPDVLRATVRNLCHGRYLGRRVLAQLLARNPDDLLKRTLNPMVGSGELAPAYASGSDPRQAYILRTSAATEQE